MSPSAVPSGRTICQSALEPGSSLPFSSCPEKAPPVSGTIRPRSSETIGATAHHRQDQRARATRSASPHPPESRIPTGGDGKFGLGPFAHSFHSDGPLDTARGFAYGQDQAIALY